LNCELKETESEESREIS